MPASLSEKMKRSSLELADEVLKRLEAPLMEEVRSQKLQERRYGLIYGGKLFLRQPPPVQG